MSDETDPRYIIRLFGDGTRPLRADRLEAQDDGGAIAMGRERVSGSRTFRRAFIYRDDSLIASLSGDVLTITR